MTSKPDGSAIIINCRIPTVKVKAKWSDSGVETLKRVALALVIIGAINWGANFVYFNLI